MSGPEDEVYARARTRIGSVVRGKYRIERVLGVGGMAVVYAARHRNNALFAIKMLHPELSMRSDIRERFIREGYIANSVGHPGAVAVVDDDVAEDGAAFIVMEMLRGAPVDSLCEQNGGKLPMAATVAIACQLLDVLAAAHQHGIVHRDIKPANVFVTLDGVVKVLDFGIARLRDAASHDETRTGMVMGTPTHMAPEQARGQASQIGPETDIWAVGATMFSLLAGEPVHVGESPQHVCILAATAPSRPIHSVELNVPPEIAHVIDGALAFQKQDRWLNAGAMRDALRAAYNAAFGVLNEREVLVDVVGRHTSQGAGRGSVPNLAEAFPATSGSGPGVGAGSAEKLAVVTAAAAGERQPLVDASAKGAAIDRPVGSTTAEPVSETGARLRRSSLRAGGGPAPRVALLLSAVGVVLAVGAGAFVRGRTPATETAAREAPPSFPPPPPAAAQALPKPEAVVVKPIDELNVVVDERPDAAVVRLATVPAARAPLAAKAPAPPSPAPSTKGQLHATPPAPAQAPAAAPSSNPDCTPNYYFDSDGVKHFKHGCY